MSDDLRMKALADTCQHCADSCRAMAGSGAAPRGPRRTGAVLSRRKTD